MRRHSSQVSQTRVYEKTVTSPLLRLCAETFQVVPRRICHILVQLQLMLKGVGLLHNRHGPESNTASCGRRWAEYEAAHQAPAELTGDRSKNPQSPPHMLQGLTKSTDARRTNARWHKTIPLCMVPQCDMFAHALYNICKAWQATCFKWHKRLNNNK